jgi:formiminotetrahydrofolate cyclodeaminase
LVRGIQAMLAELSINEFVAKLATESSPPGGGSAAALTGLLAGGVMELVINVSMAKQEEFCELLKTQQAELQIINCSLKRLIDQDAEAFQQLLIVLGKPENEAEAIEAVFQRAAELPLEIANACLALLKLAKQLLCKIEQGVISDLMTSACGAHAALTGALCSTRD